ncbi:MAG: alkaline phosphatase family protein [Pseudomonadota bacterium]
MCKWLLAAAVAFAAETASAEPVLMISIDGLQPADVINAEARGIDAPNLRAIMTEGAYAAGVVDVLPSVTYPNHTTLITGVAPALHGISSNTVFDPLRENDGGWYWYETDIRMPTLWDAVSQSGGSVASIGWPVSVGARAIDWNIPEFWRAHTAEDLKLVEALSTEGLVAELEAASGVSFSELQSEEVTSDVARAKFAASLIALKHPQFMTLHLVSLDHFEHEDGPNSQKAIATLEAIDKAVGELVATARAAEPDLVVAVVSDHGFAAISQSTNLIIPFIEAGLITYDAEKKAVTAWEAMPWGAGGSAAIVLTRPNDKKLKKQVAALLAKLAADPALKIRRVIDAKEIEKAGGAKEASFWVDFTPGVSSMGYRLEGDVVAPSGGKGTHGFFPGNPEMRASFFISGPGVPQGRNLGEVDMRAIAPTIAMRLGVKLGAAEVRPLF